MQQIAFLMKNVAKKQNFLLFLGVPLLIALDFAVYGRSTPEILFAMLVASHGALAICIWAIRHALLRRTIYTRGGGRVERPQNPVAFWASFLVLLVAAAMTLAFSAGTDWLLWSIWNGN